MHLYVVYYTLSMKFAGVVESCYRISARDEKDAEEKVIPMLRYTGYPFQITKVEKVPYG